MSDVATIAGLRITGVLTGGYTQIRKPGRRPRPSARRPHPTRDGTAHVEALGRPVAYHQATLAEYRARYTSFGASPAIVDAMVEMAEAQVAGVYPPASEASTGTTFRDWCVSVLAPAVARTAG